MNTAKNRVKKTIDSFSSYFYFIFLSFHLVNAIVTVKEDAKAEVCGYTLETILKVIASNFAPGQLLHIAFPESDTNSCFLGDFFSKLLPEKWSIIVTQKDFQERDNGISVDLPDAYIIFFNSYEGLIKLCNVLSNMTASWNPGAKFLTITTASDISTKPVTHKFVSDIINFAWSRNIFKVSLITYNTIIKTVLLFSSSPYSKNYNTCKRIANFSQLQEVNLISEDISLIDIAGYQFNPPNSFFGCPLEANTIPFPPYSVLYTNSTCGVALYTSGVDVELAKLLGKLCNFSLEIRTTPSLGTSTESHEMMENIRNYRIDLAFAGFIPSSNTYYRYSLSRSYLDNSVSWYVPGAEIIPSWKLLLNTFSVQTWLFMLLMFLLVTTLYFLMNGMKVYQLEGPVDLNMIALTLGFSIHWTKKPSIRIILLSWSLFSFHAALMFNTRLFSVLTARPVNPGITTIQQLYLSKFRACTISSYKNFYSNQTHGWLRDMMETSEVCSGLEDSVKVLLKYRNISVLQKDDYMAFLINEKRENIKRLKEKFINYPVSMSVAKGSVFIQHLNRLVFNVTESGIVLKWLKDVQLKVKPKLHSEGTEKDNFIKGHVPLLTYADFQWFFVIFLCGVGIAVVVFFIEILLK